MNTAISTPDGMVKEIWKKIPQTVKAAFFSAVVIGLMTHLYQFTNKLYNYDELMNTPSGYGTGAESGRWFLRMLADSLGSQYGNYSLPLVNGMFSVLFLALTAALIVSMFRMKSSFFAAAVGGICVSFPAVVSTFFFMYTALFYSIALFLSVLSAYLVIRFPKNLFLNALAVLLMACSIGVYQAYFANTVSLLVMSVILICAFSGEEKSWKDVFFLALRYLIILVAGLVLYLILNKVLITMWGVELLSYQGLDSMGQITAEQLFSGIRSCYRDFINLFRKDVMGLNPTGYLKKCYFLMMALLGIGTLALIFGQKSCKIKKVFLVLAYLISPMAIYLIYIMTPNGWVYALMAYPVVFIGVFMFVWADQYVVSFDKKAIIRKVTQWAAAVTSVIMIAAYIWYGNGCYMSMEYTKYHDMSYFQTMVTQIKSLDGYEDDLPIAMIGTTITDETNIMGGLINDTFNLSGKSESNISAYSRNQIITKYLGFAPVFCNYEGITQLMEKEEVQEMPCYPDSGSIKIVDGVIVIKLEG